MIVLPTLALDVWIFAFVYPRPAVIGFLGDVYNFTAAVWLAFDLLFKERETERKAAVGQLRRDIQNLDLPVTIERVRIERDEDLDKVFARRKAGEALSACLVLGLGLTLILVARLLEFMEQGKIETLWRSFRGKPF